MIVDLGPTLMVVPLGSVTSMLAPPAGPVLLTFTVDPPETLRRSLSRPAAIEGIGDRVALSTYSRFFCLSSRLRGPEESQPGPRNSH